MYDNYHDTAEANRDLADVKGSLYLCPDCGIAYSSHSYKADVFPKLYRKSYKDLSFFDSSIMQKMRRFFMREMLRHHERRFSFSRFLDFLSCYAFQAPRLQKEPKGLRILDVGCGFGEFLSIYKQLGNEVVGTELHPDLVKRVREQGFECHQGELESIDFGGQVFDVIILRAVFCRTLNPTATLNLVKSLLAPGGELALLDPCTEQLGASYFFMKQFPQGQFYIVNQSRYLEMIQAKFGLHCTDAKLIYGRPNALLKQVRTLGNILGILEIMLANLFRKKPYVLSYSLEK